LVAERLAAVRAALAGDEPKTAYEVARAVYGEAFTDATSAWLLNKALCWLTHLEQLGEASHTGDSPGRWS
jgi:hypothetical protein